MTKKAMRNKINSVSRTKYHVKSYKAKKFWMFAGMLAFTASGMLMSKPASANTVNNNMPDSAHTDVSRIGRLPNHQSQLSSSKGTSGQNIPNSTDSSHLDAIQHKSNKLVTALIANSKNQQQPSLVSHDQNSSKQNNNNDKSNLVSTDDNDQNQNTPKQNNSAVKPNTNTQNQNSNVPKQNVTKPFNSVHLATNSNQQNSQKLNSTVNNAKAPSVQNRNGITEKLANNSLYLSGDFSNYHGGPIYQNNNTTNNALKNIASLHLGNAKNLTNTHDMFRSMPNLSNIFEDGNFDTSSVTNMSNMFADDPRLHNLRGVSKLNTNQVHNMSNMFSNDHNLSDATAIKNWNTTNITNMNGMFKNDNNLQKIAIGNHGLHFFGKPFVDNNDKQFGSWDSDNSSDININNISKQGEYVNQTAVINAANNISPIGNFDVIPGSVTPASGTWGTAHWNLDSDGNFTISDGTIDGSAFSGDDPLYSSITGGHRADPSSESDGNPNIVSITINNVTSSSDLSRAFSCLGNLKSIHCYNFNTSRASSLNWTFGADPKLTDISGLSDWNVSNVSDFSEIFNGDYSLSDINPLRSWNPGNSNCSDVHINSFFQSDYSLTNLGPLSNWTFNGKVSDLDEFFMNDTSLSDLDPISAWDISHISSLNSTFKFDKSISNLEPLSYWNVSSVNDMIDLFSSDLLISDLTPIANWNVVNVNNVSGMFHSDTKLNDYQYNNLFGWRFNQIPSSSGTFYGTSMNNGSDPSFVKASDGKYKFENMNKNVSIKYTNFISNSDISSDNTTVYKGNNIDISKLNAPSGYKFLTNALTIDPNGNNNYFSDIINNIGSINSDKSVDVPVVPASDKYYGYLNHNGGGIPSDSDAKFGINNSDEMTIGNGRLYNSSNNQDFISNDINNNDALDSIHSVNFTTSAKAGSDFNYILSGLPNVSDIDLSNINSSDISTTNGLFMNDPKLNTFSNYQFFEYPKDLTSISGMFKSDSSLSSTIILSDLNTTHISDMSYLFANDPKLSDISTLSSLNPANVSNISDMFTSDHALTNWSNIYNNWQFNNFTTDTNMLKGTGIKNVSDSPTIYQEHDGKYGFINPVGQPITVHYVDQDNVTIASDTIPGSDIGTSVSDVTKNSNSPLPSGYTLNESDSGYTNVPFTHSKQTITLGITGKSVNSAPVTISASDGTTPDSTVAPNGVANYSLAGKHIGDTFSFNASDVTSGLPSYFHVNKNASTGLNTNGQITGNISADSNGNPVINFDNGNPTLSYDNDGSGTINITYAADGQVPAGNSTLTGKPGHSVDLTDINNLKIPNNFEYVNDKKYPNPKSATFQNGQATNVSITVIGQPTSGTLRFEDNDNNAINTVVGSVNVPNLRFNSDVNLSNAKVPQGFQFDNSDSFTQSVGSMNPTFDLNVHGVPVNYHTATVNTSDSNGHQGTTQIQLPNGHYATSFSLTASDVAPHRNGYTFDVNKSKNLSTSIQYVPKFNYISGTYGLTAPLFGNAVPTLYYDADPQTYHVNYIDQDGYKVGSDAVQSHTDNVINLPNSLHHIPKGFTFDSNNNPTSVNVGTGNANHPKDINVIGNSNSAPIHVRYVNQNGNVVLTHDFSGEVGDPSNIGNVTIPGYTINSGQFIHPRYNTYATNRHLSVTGNNVTEHNTITGYGPDNYTHNFTITQSGKVGNSFSFNINTLTPPDGYSFDNSNPGKYINNNNVNGTFGVSNLEWSNNNTPTINLIAHPESVKVNYINQNGQNISNNTLHGHVGDTLSLTSQPNLQIPNNYLENSNQQSSVILKPNHNSDINIHIHGVSTNGSVNFVDQHNNVYNTTTLHNLEFGSNADLTNQQAPQGYEFTNDNNYHPAVNSLNPTYTLHINGSIVPYHTATVNVKDSNGTESTATISVPTGRFNNTFSLNPANSVTYKPGFSLDLGKSSNLNNGNLNGTYGLTGVVWLNNDTPTIYYDANPQSYHFEYKNQNNQTVGTSSIQAPADSNVTLTNHNILQVPNGYTYNNSKNTSIVNVGTGNSAQNPHIVYVKGNTVSSPIKVNYINNKLNPNQTVLTKQITGQVGNSADLSNPNIVPDGYTVDNGQNIHPQYGTNSQIINIDITGKPVQESDSLTGSGPYGYTHQFPVSFSGQVGNPITKPLNTFQIPAGYSLSNNNPLSFTGTFGPHHIQWSKSNKPTINLNANPTHQVINYVNQNGVQVGTNTLNGDTGETFDLTKSPNLQIPDNYSENNNQITSTKFKPNHNSDITIHVTGDKTTATINFTDSSNDVYGTTQIPNLLVGNTADLSKLTPPSGYEFTNNNNYHPQVSSLDPNYSLTVQGVKNSYHTTTINIKDSHGNTSTKQIAVPDGRYGNSFNIDPSTVSYKPGYGLDINNSTNLTNGSLQGTYGLNDVVWPKNTVPTLYFNAGTQSYNIEYKNQNNAIVGHDTLNKPTDTVVNINNGSNLNIPNGYIFDNSKNSHSINIHTGNSGQAPKIIYVNGNAVSSPITVNYVDNSSNLPHPVTVSSKQLHGQVGNSVSLTSNNLVPTGYTVNSNQNVHPQYGTNSQTINLNITGQPTTIHTNITGLGPDNYTHQFPIMLFGRIGDPSTFNPDSLQMPDGYSLSSNIGNNLTGHQIEGILEPNHQINWPNNTKPTLALNAHGENITLNYVNQKGVNVGNNVLDGNVGETFDLTSSKNLQVPDNYIEDSNQPTSVKLKAKDNNPINIHVHGANTNVVVNFEDTSGNIYNTTTVPHAQVGSNVDLSTQQPPIGYEFVNNNNYHPLVTSMNPTYVLTVQGQPISYTTTTINTRDSAGHTGTATIQLPAHSRYGDKFTVDPSSVTYRKGFGFDSADSTNLINGTIQGTFGLNNAVWPKNVTPTLYYSANSQNYYIEYRNQNNAVVGHDSLNRPTDANVNITNGNNLHLPNGYHFDSSKNNTNINIGTGNSEQNPDIIYVAGNKNSSPITINYINSSSKLSNPVTVATKRLSGEIGNNIQANDYVPNGYTVNNGQTNTLTYGTSPQNLNLQITGKPVTEHVDIKGFSTDNYNHTFPMSFSGNVGDPFTKDPTSLAIPDGYSLDNSIGTNMTNGIIAGNLGPSGIIWPNNSVPTLKLDANPHVTTLNYVNQNNKQVGSSTISGHVGNTFDLTSSKNLHVPENYIEDPNQPTSTVMRADDNNPITIKIHGKTTNGTVNFEDASGNIYNTSVVPNLIFGNTADLTNQVPPTGYEIESSSNFHPNVSSMNPTFVLTIQGKPISYTTAIINTSDSNGNQGTATVNLPAHGRYGDTFTIDPSQVHYKHGYGFDSRDSKNLINGSIQGTFGLNNAVWPNNVTPTLFYNAHAQSYYIEYRNQHHVIVGHDSLSKPTDTNVNIENGNNLQVPNGYHFNNSNNPSQINVGTGNDSAHPKVINVAGNTPSAPITVKYLDNSSNLPNPVVVSSVPLTGTVGDNANLNSAVPNGYTVNKNQQSQAQYGTSKQNFTLTVTGKPVTEHFNIKGVGPDNYYHEFPLTFSGKVGDPISLDPSTLQMPDGYTLDPSVGSNIVNGSISGNLGPTSLVWPNHKAPQLTLDAKGTDIPITYVNQNNNPVGYGTLHGSVGQSFVLDSTHNLHIPDGYTENPGQVSDITMKPENNKAITINVTGKRAGYVHIKYKNQHGLIVGTKNYDSGVVGNTIHYADTMPKGYAEGSGQDTALTFDMSNHNPVINVLGEVTYDNHEYVLGSEPDGNTVHLPVILSGDIGNVSTYDPNNLKLPAGYTMDLSHSSNLDSNHQISAILNPSNVTWSINNDARPDIKLVPMKQSIPVTYVDKATGSKVGTDTISDVTDTHKEISNGQNLHLPNGYHFDNSNPTTVNFHAHNNPLTIYVDGNPTVANITYRNQNGTLVGNSSVNGVVGSTANLSQGTLPVGYQLKSPHNVSPKLAISNNQFVVPVQGVAKTLSANVNIKGDNGLSNSASVTFHGNVGDKSSVNPNTITVPNGYHLDIGHSTNLDNGNITAQINANHISWPNQQPTIYFDANGEEIPVKYVNQHNQQVGIDTLNGTNNGTFNINNNTLHLPPYYTLSNNNPTSMIFHTNNPTLTLHVTGTHAGDIKINYINQHNVPVGSPVIHGNVGDSIDFSNYVPQGYQLNNGSNNTLEYNGQKQSANVIVQGLPQVRHVNINETRDFLPDKTVPITMTANTGDIATVDPHSLPVDAGYTLDESHSHNLVNNQIKATVTPTGISWKNNNSPILHESANPASVTVHFINQFGQYLASANQHLNGKVNAVIPLSNLSVPSGYEYNASYPHNPAHYQFTDLPNQVVNVHLDGVKAAPITIHYVNQRGFDVNNQVASGHVGDTATHTEVPAGYHLNPGQSFSIPFKLTPQSDVLMVTGNNITDNIDIPRTIVVPGHGTTKISDVHQAIHTQVGNSIVISPYNYVPEGTKIIDGTKYHFLTNNNEAKNNHRVPFTYEALNSKNSSMVQPIMVQYINQNHKLVGQHNVNGYLTEAQTTNQLGETGVPDGYTMTNNQNAKHVFTNQKQSPVKVFVNGNLVHYHSWVNTTKDHAISHVVPITVTGHVGDTQNFNLASIKVPAGYHSVYDHGSQIPVSISADGFHWLNNTTPVVHFVPNHDNQNSAQFQYQLHINLYNSNGKLMPNGRITKHIPVSGLVGDTYTVNSKNYIPTGYYEHHNSSVSGTIMPNGLSNRGNVTFTYITKQGGQITINYANHNHDVGHQTLQGYYHEPVNNSDLQVPKPYQLSHKQHIQFGLNPQTINVSVIKPKNASHVSKFVPVKNTISAHEVLLDNDSHTQFTAPQISQNRPHSQVDQVPGSSANNTDVSRFVPAQHQDHPQVTKENPTIKASERLLHSDTQDPFASDNVATTSQLSHVDISPVQSSHKAATPQKSDVKTVPVPYHYLYAVKPMPVYDSLKPNQGHVLDMVQPHDLERIPIVNAYSVNVHNQPQTKFEVEYHNQTGFVDSNQVENAYYDNLHNISYVKVLHNFRCHHILAHHTVHFRSRKGTSYPSGTILHVVGIKEIDTSGIYRFQLSDGKFITANKAYIKAI